MSFKTRTVPFHVKEINDAGTFTGYASVFDVLDYYRDVVRAGAFAKTLAAWKSSGRLPPLLWQHDAKNPLGPHEEMYEDEKGLYVKGRLLIDDVPQARTAYALLKAKVISGMSIGFDIEDDGMEYDGKTNVWNLTSLDLWENSLATFPANEECEVDEVKAVGTGMKISEFEDLLRDVAGLPRSKAKQVAGLAFSRLLRDAGGRALRDVEMKQAAGVDLSPILNYLKQRETT
jgi:phage prohead protease, HK97 family